jgi:hypothetical protein
VGRFPQPSGGRGSLKWIQRAVNDPARPLDRPILAQLPGARCIEWRSPLAEDGCAEYRDGAFLDRLGLGDHRAALDGFWPARGPQWDALARTDAGDVLLVEAKAHVAELCSPPAQAGEASLARIRSALSETMRAAGAAPLADWHLAFYQLANRLAHLHFLRSRGIAAWLVLVNFVGDWDMEGPAEAGEWRAAYQVVWHVMGLGRRNPLVAHVIEVHPHVRELGGSDRG